MGGADDVEGRRFQCERYFRFLLRPLPASRAIAALYHRVISNIRLSKRRLSKELQRRISYHNVRFESSDFSEHPVGRGSFLKTKRQQWRSFGSRAVSLPSGSLPRGDCSSCSRAGEHVYCQSFELSSTETKTNTWSGRVDITILFMHSLTIHNLQHFCSKYCSANSKHLFVVLIWVSSCISIPDVRNVELQKWYSPTVEIKQQDNE